MLRQNDQIIFSNVVSRHKYVYVYLHVNTCVHPYVMKQVLWNIYSYVYVIHTYIYMYVYIYIYICIYISLKAAYVNQPRGPAYVDQTYLFIEYIFQRCKTGTLFLILMFNT